ncbi:MAG: hypothetical protein MdMp024_1187 [Bacteroidales bacterium]
MMCRSFFIKRKIQSLVKKSSVARQGCFCSLNEAKTFLIVFHIKDKGQVSLCVERLKKLGKKTRLCVFIPKNMKTLEAVDTSWLQVKEELFDSAGLPSKIVCEKFYAVQADVLLDLTRPGDYVMHFLQLMHPASFKVGNKSALRNIFDLIIPMGCDDTIPQYFEYILFYLQTIRSK